MSKKDIHSDSVKGEKLSNTHFDSNPSTSGWLSSPHFQLARGAVPNAVRYTYAWWGSQGRGGLVLCLRRGREHPGDS